MEAFYSRGSFEIHANAGCFCQRLNKHANANERVSRDTHPWLRPLRMGRRLRSRYKLKLDPEASESDAPPCLWKAYSSSLAGPNYRRICLVLRSFCVAVGCYNNRWSTCSSVPAAYEIPSALTVHVRVYFHVSSGATGGLP